MMRSPAGRRPNAHLLVASVAVVALAACGGSQNTGAAPSPTPTPGTPIVYTAVGASDAIGYQAVVKV